VTPDGGESEIIQLHPQGIIPTYEIELDDGRTTRCSAEHIWHVSYRTSESGDQIWENVTTQFMIDNPSIDFEIPESVTLGRVLSEEHRKKIKKITRIEDQKQQCISLRDERGLYITDSHIVTHNSPATVYTQVFCAASMKKSSELLFEPLMLMIESSEFFEKVHTKEGMMKRERDFKNAGDAIDRIFWTTAVPTSAIQFSNGANFKLISNPGGLLGQTIVMGSMTELTFFYEAGHSEDQVYKFFTKLRSRIESRMKGNYFGRFILDSSPNTLESVIDDWIVNQAPKNPVNYSVKGSRWKWSPEDYSKDTFDEFGNVRPEKGFPVFVGGGGRPPSIIEHEAVDQYSPTDIIYVPDEPRGRGIFEENVFEALKDLAGLPAGSSDKIFYDYAKIENIFTTKLRQIETHITAPSTDEPDKLIWEQIKYKYFIKILDKYRFWYKPHIPRVFAIDQSITGDVTSIVVAHVERELVPYSPDVTYRDVYILDMIINIVPAGGRINLDAIRYFISDLQEVGNILFLHGSFDSFESEATTQFLNRRGIKVEKLSVDRTMDAYLNFISVIESGRLKSGRSIHLKNNLKSLQITQRKGAGGKKTGSKKVDHTNGEIVLDGNSTWERSTIGIHAKDAADASCACVELLRMYDVLATDIYCEDAIVERTQASAERDVSALLLKMGMV
jgi:hypothetical protein